jgi:enamine deaminase RidA (YjgF/YER057c/UK114 family)
MIERLRLDGKLPDPISHYTDAVRADNTLWISGVAT